MKRIKVELLALGFAAALTALLTVPIEPPNIGDSKALTVVQICAESAIYLDGPVKDARFHRATGRWAVTDGHTTAWLDARTGELLEVELRPAR
jgi:hypothetical protein